MIIYYIWKDFNKIKIGEKYKDNWEDTYEDLKIMTPETKSAKLVYSLFLTLLALPFDILIIPFTIIYLIALNYYKKEGE